MTENQIRVRALFSAALAIALILIAGCYPSRRIPPELTEVKPEAYWTDKREQIHPHKKRAVVEALEGVRKKAASGSSLDSLGVSTLKEAIVLLEDARSSAPLIADVIEGRDTWADVRGEPYYWKLRYWCIDMAAYMNEAGFSGMLSSIVSSDEERYELRVRAVRTLREMKAEAELKKLFTAAGNAPVREEIARALLSFD